MWPALIKLMGGILRSNYANTPPEKLICQPCCSLAPGQRPSRVSCRICALLFRLLPLYRVICLSWHARLADKSGTHTTRDIHNCNRCSINGRDRHLLRHGVN